MTSRRFPAIVFDFDGTLVDSAPDLHAALNQLLTESGRIGVSLAQVRQFIGDGAAKLVERGLEASGAPLSGSALAERVIRFLAIYEPMSADRTLPYPGVVETLGRLADAGHRMGLCTNKPERATRLMLAALKLDRFLTAVVGGDTLAVKKPRPEPLRSVLDQLGVAPDQAIMVGDNEHDVATAHAAGVKVIVVAYGYARVPLAELRVDGRIEAFADLPAALADLARA